ncbi:MAG: hypothetical protein ACRDHN_08480 [Thermomicrobiales bacterium]
MPNGTPPPAPADDESFSAWPLVISIGFAKLATLITILYLSWGHESAKMVASTLAPWLAVVVAFLIAPLGWQIRMRRMRRRRAALLNAEFMRANLTPEIAPPFINQPDTAM